MARNESTGGVRGWLNNNPAIAIGLLVLVVGGVAYFMFGSGGSPLEDPNAQPAYYTIDLGATHFTAKGMMPPFDREGKEAVGVAMFTCDGGATRFPGYLYRLTEQGKSQMKQIIADANKAGLSAGPPVNPETEVRKIGADGGDWVQKAGGFDVANIAARAQGGAASQSDEITEVKCPDGTTPASQVYAF